MSASHSRYGDKGLTDNSNSANSAFDPYYNIVELKGIKLENGLYKLDGNNVTIANLNAYTSTTSFFDFKRHEPTFEAVMSYYYLDNTISYAKTLINDPIGKVTCDPHAIGSGYNNSFIQLDDGDNHISQVDAVDQGEDGMFILHEGMHFIHHSLAGITLSVFGLGFDGVAEGIADYWALSEVNKYKEWKDYEDDYWRIFRWSNFNPGTNPSNFTFKTTDRMANWNIPYTDNNMTYTGHYFGTILSGALLNIYNDIGKEKTDKMVLHGLSSIKFAFTKQPEIATAMFEATGPNNLNFEDWERCVIWNHFNRTYNIPTNGGVQFLPLTFDKAVADYYMKDDLDDVGTEINPTSQDMWLSEDIWVRPTNDNIMYHDNPIYRKDPISDKNNYVKVKVRSRGCNPLTNAILKVYWSKASTGLSFPGDWELSFDAQNRKISDQIGTFDLASLNLECGKEAIVSFPWIPPNPDDFDDQEKHHYCLLARIESSVDPMFCPNNGGNINAHVKCNNNVVWKNVTILTTPGFRKDTGTVFIKDILGSPMNVASCLEIKDVVMPHFYPTLDNINLSVQLRQPLLSIWIAGGMQGSGISYNEGTGLLNITSLSATLCNLNLAPNVRYFMDFFPEGKGNTKPYAFDLRHYKMAPDSRIIGGERFIYPGIGTDILPREKSNSNSDRISFEVGPNPFIDRLNISLKSENNEFNILIYDINSKLLFSKSFNGFQGSNLTINLDGIEQRGVLFVELNTNRMKKVIKVVRI